MNLFGGGYGSAAYTAVEWAIRISALLIVPLRRSPASSRAWLLLLLFLPVPGLLLYLLIGRPTYSRARLRRLDQARSLLDGAAREIAHSRHCRRPGLSASFEQAERLIERLGRFPALGNNDVELLPDYDRAIDQLVREIDAAEHHVHLLTYIFADDRTGAKVMDALGRAAARGVRCRVLIDAVGSRRWARRVGGRLSAAGVFVAAALPIAPWRRGSARADLRNHRKIAIIDGRAGLLGSQNIVNAEARPHLVYEELVLRLAGPVVLEMQAVFAVDWFLETEEVISGDEYFPHEASTGGVTAQLMPSGPDYRDGALDQLTAALIHGARSSVVITTPYFIPEAALVQALRTAVLRGVTVCLVVSSVSDQIMVHLAQRSYYAELLEAGVRIYRYRDRFLHAKHISIDQDIALIGSSNIDVRSFVLNAEVTLVIYDKQVSSQLAAVQQRQIGCSEALELREWQRRPLATRIAENLARLMSPLL